MMSRFSILLAALLLAAPVLAQQPQQAQPTAQQPANGNAQAAAPVQSQPPAQDQATAQLDQATKDLKRLSAAVDGARDDDNRLADIKVEVDAVGKRIIATSVATRPQLDEIKARLAELGDPPAEGAPPEADVVTQERKRLTAERGAINALTGNAENLSIQATKLSNSITAIRRDLFSNALFKHTDISWGMFGDAVGSISAEYQALSRSIGSWLTFAWNYKRFALLSSIFLSLCAAFVLVSGTRRLFYPLIRNKADVSEPGYITRLTVAFWSTMVPTLVMVVFSASSYFFLNTFNVLRSDIAPLILVTLGLGVVLVFVSQLARAVLSPREPAWRLVNVSDHGAALLFSGDPRNGGGQRFRLFSRHRQRSPQFARGADCRPQLRGHDRHRPDPDGDGADPAYGTVAGRAAKPGQALAARHLAEFRRHRRRPHSRGAFRLCRAWAVHRHADRHHRRDFRDDVYRHAHGQGDRQAECARRHHRRPLSGAPFRHGADCARSDRSRLRPRYLCAGDPVLRSADPAAMGLSDRRYRVPGPIAS